MSDQKSPPAAPSSALPPLGDHGVAVLERVIAERSGVELLPIADPRRPDGTPAVELASLPAQRRLVSLLPFLDEYLPRPLRRQGTVTVRDQASFLALVERFRSEQHTVVFANPDERAPSVTAIFDYHAPGPVEAVGEAAGDRPTGWGRHRAVLALETSEAWDAWLEADARDEGFLMPELAAFLQDRIGDLVYVDLGKQEELKARLIVEDLQAKVGSPQQLMQLARNFEVRAAARVRNAHTLETGEATLIFEEEHTAVDKQGGTMTVPTLFFITIPIFYGGEPYRIPVRLRYRAQGPAIRWFIALHRADKAFEDAFTRVLDAIRAGANLPVWLGTPEG